MHPPLRSSLRRLRLASALAGLLALAALGCAPKDPVVTPRVARVLAVAPSGLNLAIDLEVHNPNSFALAVHAVQGQVLLGNGAVLGHGVAYPQGSIPAEGARMVTAQLNVPWVNLGALTPFAFTAGPVPYVFRGEATIGGESLNIKLPFEVAGELTREQLLAAGLRGI